MQAMTVMEQVSSVDHAIATLRQTASTHPLWSCSLLRACSAGSLSRDDFRFVFSQYYLYSKNFSRYIAALIAKCEDDYLRSRLSHNLWDEGGGADPDKRHAEMFRRFLRDALGVDIGRIEYLEVTRAVVRQVLDTCSTATPAAAAAFLSLGTEGIVARLYGQFVDGLRRAGVTEHLDFFEVHMACDDDHAATLEQIARSYANEPGWYETCLAAMNLALDLRKWFFDELARALSERRTRVMFDRIQAREPLRVPGQTRATFVRSIADGTPLYRSHDSSVQFDVQRLPFCGEVIDPRVVRIAAGASNEDHRHAHETLMVFLDGHGEVVIDGVRCDVCRGDIAFVPRWLDHQVRNTGTTELVYLGITDFGLASKVYAGDYLSGHRAHRDHDRSHASATPS